MSDVSGGPGWWQASDGKWYRPEQHPDYRPPSPPPPPTMQSARAVPAPPTAPPSVPQGWYQDPSNPALSRYWDGSGWMAPQQLVQQVQPTAPYPQQAAPGQYTLRLTRHIALLLIGFGVTATKTGTFEECEAFYKSVRLWNWTFGMLSFWSLIFVPALYFPRNKRAFEELRRVAGR